MRIWSLHPKYLDTKGLVALWRETLLAKHVLSGDTKGYKNHPQLERFKSLDMPVDAINQYLTAVYAEAYSRAYHFNKEKISFDFKPVTIKVTNGQLEYEKIHLLKKLEIRDKKKFLELNNTAKVDAHPIFIIEIGEIEKWEIIRK